MKKLIVMAVVAGAAAFAQAASIKWQTGGSIKPDGETLAGDGTLAIYTFALADQGAYDSLSLDSIWST